MSQVLCSAQINLSELGSGSRKRCTYHPTRSGQILGWGGVSVTLPTYHQARVKHLALKEWWELGGRGAGRGFLRQALSGLCESFNL